MSFAFLGRVSGQFEFWNDPWNFLDVALIGGLSLGVLRKSRSAALALFVYFIISKTYITVEMGRPAEIGVALVFLYYYGRAIQGSFVYHRIRRNEYPGYKPAARWNYFVWPPVALLVLVLILFGLSSVLHITPPTGVIRGEQLQASDLDLLFSQEILDPGEVVVLFYSAGFLSIREGGNMLTERRVISYEEAEGQLFMETAEYQEIEDAAVERKGNFFNDTVISVTTSDGKVFRLLASTEKKSDLRLIKELRDRWHAARR